MTTLSPPIWLDQLPADVLSLIFNQLSLHLCPSHHSLAVSTPRLLSCIRSHFSHTLSLHDLRTKLSPWIPLFLPTLTTLHINSKPRSIDPYVDQYVPLLAAPNLSTLTLRDDPILLSNLHLCTNLRSLHINIFAESSLTTFFAALPSLPLTNLTLRYSPLHRNPCLCGSTTYFSPTHNILTSSCPSLKFLHFHCCCTPTPYSHPLLRLLPTLPPLSHLNVPVFTTLPSSLLPLLRPIDSICITSPCRTLDAHALALNLASQVVKLFLHDDLTLSASQISALSACPNLHTLQVAIEVGADEAFGELLPCLGKLRTLEVRGPSEHVLANMVHSDGDMQYGALASGILRAVGAVEGLQELRLVRLRWKPQDLIESLERAGKGLVALELWLIRGMRVSLKDLERVFWGVLKCAKLQCVGMASEVGFQLAREAADVGEERMGWMMLAMKEIKKRSWMNNSEDVEIWVRTLLEGV